MTREDKVLRPSAAAVDGRSHRFEAEAAAAARTKHTAVIAGLDPAIHPLRAKMDARVKPAHDSHGLTPRARYIGSVLTVRLSISPRTWA